MKAARHGAWFSPKPKRCPPIGTFNGLRGSPATLTPQRGREANNSIFFLLVPFLSGCPATLPPAPTEVLIPVTTACVTRNQLPPSPLILTDRELKLLPDYQFVLELGIARTALTQYAKEQSALLEACIR